MQEHNLCYKETVTYLEQQVKDLKLSHDKDISETARKQKIKLNRADEDIGLYDFAKVTETEDDDVCDTDRSFTKGDKNFETK